MTLPVRPNKGGFLRPFGTGIFIRDFLMGKAPFGSPAIDPDKGACQEDVFYHYKVALHRAYARDRAEREIEGLTRRNIWSVWVRERAAERDITEAEAEAELAEEMERRYFEEIAYKLTRCRYHSFRRYFHWLKQLGWVEATGQEEDSTVQEATDYHPDAQPRIIIPMLPPASTTASPGKVWRHPMRTGLTLSAWLCPR